MLLIMCLQLEAHVIILALFSLLIVINYIKQYKYMCTDVSDNCVPYN